MSANKVCQTQVGIFSYELLKNIKELKIYQDIFDMDAKATCHEMRIDRSFSLFQINVISNEHFTVIEDTGVTEDKEFICNNRWC